MYFISFHPVGTSNCLNICSEHFVQNETTSSFMYICGVFHHYWHKVVQMNDYLMERDGDEMVVYFKAHVMRSSLLVIVIRGIGNDNICWIKILKTRDVNYLADLLFAPSERRLRCSLAWQTIGFNLLCRVAWEEKKEKHGKRKTRTWLMTFLCY